MEVNGLCEVKGNDKKIGIAKDIKFEWENPEICEEIKKGLGGNILFTPSIPMSKFQKFKICCLHDIGNFFIRQSQKIIIKLVKKWKEANGE